MQNNIKILLADDHDTIISGLKYELSEKFVNIDIRAVKNTKKALEIARITDFDIAIIDISFKNEDNFNGIELCRKIKIIKPEIKLISYTGYATCTHYLNQLLEIGVDAIISKNDGNFFIKNTIERIISGEMPAHSPDVITALKKNIERKEKNKFSFTPREKEILKLIHKHYSYPGIAKELSLSINTVKTHAKNLHIKCGVSNKLDLIDKTLNIIDLL